MASLIGLHMRSNGIKQIPSRAVLSLNGAGLGGDETHADTITVLRDTRVFPDGEAPPDWRTYDGSNWPAFGAYWYSERTVDGGNLKSAWYKNPADYYQITNEQGGGEGPDVEGNYIQLVKVERAIMQAANADGRKCCVLNLAGGSPGDFELWKQICAPFIVEAWQNGGNVYGRHCYADWFVEDDGRINNGQPQRVINELEYLRSIGYGGGMVLTECGLYGGYGVASYDYFEQQVTRWEQTLRPYADIFIGLCWWELGSSEFNADYTAHLKQLLPYIQAGDLPRWAPPTQPPDNGGNDMTQVKTAVFGSAAGLSDKTVTGLELQYSYKEDGALKWVNLGALPMDGIDLVKDIREIRIRVFVNVPRDAPTDPNPPPVVLTLPRGSKGVDLSNYQAGFFDLVDPADFDFYIFRCSDGMETSATSNNHDANGVDKSLWTFADVGHASGKPWGIYHFLRPGNVQGQIDKVLGIYQQLIDRGTPPRTAVFDDGTPFPLIWPDIEDWSLNNALIKQFFAGVGVVSTTGIYTRKNIWDALTAGIEDKWWSNKAAWIAAYGNGNDGTLANWPDGPTRPNGMSKIHIWQYTSEGQNVTDWNGDGLDMNITGPYPPTVVQPPPPTPPAGKTINFTNYLIPPSSIGPFLVFEKAAGGTIDHQMQMKDGIAYVVKRAAVGTEYEELRISNGYIERRYDTSPSDGLPYKLDDGYGWSKWMPVTMTEGEYFKRSPRVTKYDVADNCQLVADQGISESYIYFAKYHDSYTLPGGKVKTAVCELHWLWAPGGQVLERYFVAPGLWYIQWGNGDALHYLNEEPQGREPLPLTPIPCLD